MTGVIDGRGRRSAVAQPESVSETASFELGNGIRTERIRQGLTLAQLGEMTALSTSALSQIERGLVDPSIASLRKIAIALGVPMFHFLTGTSEPSPVVRRDERKIIESPDHDVVYELVTPDIRGAFEVLSLTLGPNSVSSENGCTHDSDESIVVLNGELTVELAGQTHTLYDGDSIFIHRQLPHRVVNLTGEPVDTLIVISPANY